MADKSYDEKIVNIAHPETTLPVSVYTCKWVIPKFMKKHVSFNLNIFGKYAVISTNAFFQIWLMIKINYIKKFMGKDTQQNHHYYHGICCDECEALWG